MSLAKNHLASKGLKLFTDWFKWFFVIIFYIYDISIQFYKYTNKFFLALWIFQSINDVVAVGLAIP